jgi:hypothetical protein
MRQISEKEIAKQIAELINRNVNSLKQDDEKWKNHYESVMSELDYEIKEAIQDFSESKLSINRIEQEGYLRCLEVMVNRFRAMESFNIS